MDFGRRPESETGDPTHLRIYDAICGVLRPNLLSHGVRRLGSVVASFGEVPQRQARERAK